MHKPRAAESALASPLNPGTATKWGGIVMLMDTVPRDTGPESPALAAETGMARAASATAIACWEPFTFPSPIVKTPIGLECFTRS